ncbi:hypothetical protein C8J56DRAFT_1070777 [Mycena floridula]|nr:hypothetical protein C8J56DRAFT_1070777 [Mycena floridula]
MAVRTKAKAKVSGAPIPRHFHSCPHLCQRGVKGKPFLCRDGTARFLWHGNGIKRHVKKTAHPDCSPSCPGFEFSKSAAYACTPTTKRQISEAQEPFCIPRTLLQSLYRKDQSPLKSTRLLVIYMTEPARNSTPENVTKSKSLDFSRVPHNGKHLMSISYGWLKAAFPEQIWIVDDAEESHILFNNWLQVPVRLQQHGCEVLLWSQDEFLTNDRVKKAHLILGGIDHTMDSQAYDHKQYDKLVARTLELEAEQPYITWPGSRMSRITGDKLHFIVDILDYVAVQRQERRPVTTALDLPSSPSQSWIESWNSGSLYPNVVLKRGFSDCGNCVVLPSNRKKKLPKWDQVRPMRQYWFSQELVSNLLELGEYRVFCLDGTPRGVVHTKPKGEQMECMVDGAIIPLDLLKMDNKLPLATENALFDPKKGEMELFDWTKQVLDCLIYREEGFYKCRSSLRDFCRIDIGIINKDKIHSYFINEIERDRSTCFFSNTYTMPQIADRMWQDMSEIFLYHGLNNHRMEMELDEHFNGNAPLEIDLSQ